jgi:UDP-GlcNAc:undecaprenyl-phosphate GlcNAc-1-phosphate transferase
MGLPIFRPDRRHIHHRLLQSGLSRRRAVITLYALSLVFLAIAFVAFWSDGRLIPVLFGCVFLVLLAVAPSLGMIRNWLTVGRAVGNSIQMRREVQYALLLRNFIELEAERSSSVEELCKDLQFICRKLGFVELSISAAGEERTWRHVEGNDFRDLHTISHDLQLDGSAVRITLRAPASAMELKRFQLMSELVAEAWLHASRRWRKAHQKPFVFEPSPSASSSASRPVFSIRPVLG